MHTENWESMNSEKVKSLVESNENASIIEQKLPEIRKIASDAVDILSDGFQFSDVISMFKIVGPLMELADEIDGYSNEEKEEFVADAAWLIYKTVDTYPDGESNRINIPVLFGSLETKFEKKAVDFITRSAINAVYAYGKKHDLFE